MSTKTAAEIVTDVTMANYGPDGDAHLYALTQRDTEREEPTATQLLESASLYNDLQGDGVRALMVAAIDADRAQPVTVFAAVVEWPEDLSDSEPVLILARSDADRDERIASALQGMADALTNREWAEAIANAGSADWSDWLDALEETEYGRPFVSRYDTAF